MATKIIVKNGDWDKARAELGSVLDRNKANFNAQFDAAFGARKPAAAEPVAAAQPIRSGGKLILSRSSQR